MTIDLSDGLYTATFDRLVDGSTAIILIESLPDDSTVKEQIELDNETIPPNVSEGDIIELALTNGNVESINRLSTETTDRQSNLQKRLDKLSQPLSEKDNHSS